VQVVYTIQQHKLQLAEPPCRALPSLSRSRLSPSQANIWIAVFSFIGNYFWTHYFYKLLGASYTFPAWKLNEARSPLFSRRLLPINSTTAGLMHFFGLTAHALRPTFAGAHLPLLNDPCLFLLLPRPRQRLAAQGNPLPPLLLNPEFLLVTRIPPTTTAPR
jgi:hypothetical protein